jgi:hypothetical protein
MQAAPFVIGMLQLLVVFDCLCCRDGYGLSHNANAPEAVQRYDTSERAAETRARLEEAARRKAEEERAKAAQRGQRKEYKAGGLTGEGQLMD